MVDVRNLGDGGFMVGVDEVNVIRSPTNHEYSHHYCKHLNKL